MFFRLIVLTILSLSITLISCNQVIIKKEPKVSTNVKTLPAIPEYMYFAGEKIILKDWDIRERLDREILVNTYFQSATRLIIKRSKR